MALAHSPRVVTNGLVLYIDAANRKGISPLGCTGFNNAPALAKNLVSPSDVITDNNGIVIGNLNFYTIFAINYPEGSFGGDAALRDGITPGFNVRSGVKTFDFGRALNYAVFDNNTQSWVKTTVYDSYLGTAAVDTFVSEFNAVTTSYPNAIHVVAGSHRDTYHTAAQYEILRDLGAPADVDTIINFSAPEWILIGRPGLGQGNAYGWAFQNYSTDPDHVAHLNVGIPIFGNSSNYFLFDGIDEYFDLPNDLGYNLNVSAFAWFKHNNTPVGNYHIIFGGAELELSITTAGVLRSGITTSSSRQVLDSGSGLTDGNWHHVGFTYNGSTLQSYINGLVMSSRSITGSLVSSFSNRRIGRFGSSTGYYLNGALSSVSMYNRALLAQEVLQNYNSTRSRHGR
jgi:hypothetical protein